MKIQQWIAEQKKEALGKDNRYFFWLAHGRSGNDEELMMYYILNGGASGYAKRKEKLNETIDRAG